MMYVYFGMIFIQIRLHKECVYRIYYGITVYSGDNY